MGEFHEICLSPDEIKVVNPKDLFSSYQNNSTIQNEYLTIKNLGKFFETITKACGVALIPFFSFFIEIHYIFKTKGKTISYFLNLDRISHGKPVFSLKSLCLHLFHLVMYFNLNSAMFFFVIINILPIQDSSLIIYQNNGLNYLYFVIILVLFYYLTYKIRPFNRNLSECDTSEQLRNSFDMNFVQNIEFLGDFPEDLSDLRNKENSVSIYQLAEVLEKSFKQNVEEFITNRFNSQKLLMTSFGFIHIVSMFVIFYDYFYSNNKIEFFSCLTLFYYSFLNNFVFAGCFVYLYTDYTYSKNISTNKGILDMIKYDNLEKKWCDPRKEKKFPTLNFLDVDNLYLWNKLRKWNLKKTGEKKTVFIDLIIVLIILYVSFIKIILLIKIFIGKDVFFLMSYGIMVSLLIQVIGLEIILVWKFFQGAYANCFFQKFREHLYILLEDVTFLRLNFDKIQSLKRMEKLILTNKEKFFIYLFEQSKKNLNDVSFETVKKKLKDCELMINCILIELNMDEKVNQLKFGLVVPMNFTVLKSLIVTISTICVTFIRLLLSH